MSLLLSGAVIVFTADAFGLLGPRSTTYILAAAVILSAVLIEARAYRNQWQPRPGATALCFLLFGWVAAVSVSAMVNGEWAPDTMVILYGVSLPAAMILIYGATPYRLTISSSAFRAAATNVTAHAFAVCAVVDGMMRISSESPQGLVNHERVFVAILVISMPITRFARITRVLVLLAIALAAWRYPSATMVTAGIAASLAFVLLHAKTKRGVVLLIVIALAGVAALGPLLEQILVGFYSAVGRTDNTTTRQFLWQQAEIVLSSSPVGGGWASVSITGVANIDNRLQLVPFHNSLLTLGVVGGVVAISGFAVLMAVVVTSAFLASDLERRFARRWLPSLAAAVASVSVNPVLENPGTSTVFFALVFCGCLRAVNVKSEVS